MARVTTRNPSLQAYPHAASQPDPDDALCGPRGAWWWTGHEPAGVMTSLAMPDLRTCSRQDVLDYFDNTWTLTEVLFASLQGEAAFFDPPYHQLRHPLIFYYGHPAALYVNKLRVAGLTHDPLDAYFEHLFEAGVDEMSWDDLSKNEMAWPAVRDVHAYRRRVYTLVHDVIDHHPGLAEGHAPIGMDSPLWALFMCFEHERIHLETSSVLIRELPLDRVAQPTAWPARAPLPTSDTHDNPFVAIEGGTVQLGKPLDAPTYGWDNEYGTRRVATRPFKATRDLITNRELLEFVQAGGYREARFWSAEGWAWRSYRNVKWPTFWVPDGPAGSQRFRLRTCFEVIELPATWPAVVNYHEATAYCRWRTERDRSALPYRLLTETEHHRLRGREPVVDANLNLRFGSECAVDAMPAAPTGCRDVFGNVWQWAEDDFHPLDGFHVHPYYDDFSTPCFDGKHKMIFGGSFASTGDEASMWARFHFRPHFFQHAGFRLAVSDDGDPTCDAVLLSAPGGGVYESQQTLAEYLTLHYGATDDAMPYAFGPKDALEFPKRCADLVIELASRFEVPMGQALDLGCAVGRSTFELASRFTSVVGIDLSTTFIATANRMKAEGVIPFRRKDEGDRTTLLEARAPSTIDRERVTFRRGDACALPADLGAFDAVLAANLLCRLPSPRACLSRMEGLVKPGGLLVMVSPYSWLEQFTPREAWLGGTSDGRSRDAVIAYLHDDFQLVDERDVPLVIREHARKFQYIVSHAMAFRRRR